MSGNSEKMHCGILFNMPYSSNEITLIGGIWDLLLRWMQLHLILISQQYTWIHSAYFMPKTSRLTVISIKILNTKIWSKLSFTACIVFTHPGCKFPDSSFLIHQRWKLVGFWFGSWHRGMLKRVNGYKRFLFIHRDEIKKTQRPQHKISEVYQNSHYLSIEWSYPISSWVYFHSA